MRSALDQALAATCRLIAPPWPPSTPYWRGLQGLSPGFSLTAIATPGAGWRRVHSGHDRMRSPAASRRAEPWRTHEYPSDRPWRCNCCLMAGCATSQPGYSNYGGGSYNSGNAGYSQGRCADCGIVTRIDAVQSNRSAPSATGAVLGGIVGAVAGRTISHETGGSKGNQNVATVLGAGAGAVAGNAIQNNVTGEVVRRAGAHGRWPRTGDQPARPGRHS